MAENLVSPVLEEGKRGHSQLVIGSSWRRKIGIPSQDSVKIYNYQPSPYQSLTLDHEHFKDEITDQSNTTRIRPILLSFNGMAEDQQTRSDKMKALDHLLLHYVDESPLTPMTKVSGKLESEGIQYFELVAAGFASKDISIAEVSKESSCAFGILSAFKQKHQLPILVSDSTQPTDVFDDPLLNQHFHEVYKYLHNDEHVPKEQLQDIATKFHQALPEGIALVNIWDVDINERVQHFLQALRGHLYNSHIWIVLDVQKEDEVFDDPPNVPHRKDSIGNELTKFRSHLDYLLRSGRMCDSHHGNRKETMTIFGKYSEEQQLKAKIPLLERKIQQKAKHIGISQLVEPKIHPINLNGHGITDDSSFRLYWKFLQLVYDKPYVEIPISWVFLRSLFYRSDEKFITKSDLLAKAKECGMDEKSLDEFCRFYTSFGSIFDLTLVNPNYKYVIVKPMGFLKALNGILSPEETLFQEHPLLQYGIVSEKMLNELFGKNWPIFIDALVSLDLATQIDSQSLDAPDVDPNGTYYFIPLSRGSKGPARSSDIHVKTSHAVDPSCVYWVTTIDTPHVRKQALLVKRLLQSLPNSKLVNCSDKIEVAVKDVSSDTTITMVSSNPATKLAISRHNPELYHLVVEIIKEIAEYYEKRNLLVKYQYIVPCAKNKSPVSTRSMLKSHYHILPNDELCQECRDAGKVNDELCTWNEALKKFPVPPQCKPDGTIKLSELIYTVAKVSDYQQFQGFEKEKLINELLLAWDQHNSTPGVSELEPRRAFARKIIELGAKHPDDQHSYFEELAKEIDLNVPTVNEFNREKEKGLMN